MKADYLTRLSRAARWYLSKAEAEDVITDYRDIAGQPPRPEEELERELGRPRDVARQLVQPRPYRVWLAVFAALAACILIPGVSPLGPFWHIWDMCFAGPFTGYFGRDGHWGPVLALLGVVGAVAWFRWQGRKEERLPRTLPVLLAVLLVWLGAVLLLNWTWMRDPQGFLLLWGKMPSIFSPDRMVSRLGQTMAGFYQYGGVAMALIGTFGLVRARTEDRRWIGVYVLRMAAMLVSMESLAVITDMSVKSHALSDWWQRWMQYYLTTAALGLVGTGVSLC